MSVRSEFLWVIKFLQKKKRLFSDFFFFFFFFIMADICKILKLADCNFSRNFFFLPKMGKTGSKRSKIRVFKVFQKLYYFFYLKLVLNESSLALYLDNSYLGKLWFWVMNKNALTQSDCKIYKLAILQEKLDELTWFLASRYRFKKHRKWFVNFNIPRTLYLLIMSRTRFRVNPHSIVAGQLDQMVECLFTN